MPTPLADAVFAHTAQNKASFHTPGHKGHAAPLDFLSLPEHDLTELPDTGSLYDGGDVIEEAERLAAQAFGAAHTLFSGGGCTLCIQTMLLLGAGAGGHVLMARNSHRSAVHAAALLGLEVEWLWPTDIQPTAADVSEALNAHPQIQAVYITSPDYYGNLCDVAAIAAVCHAVGALLLVDNAHGSHLGAFERHPLALGADMTADSAHKTLPVLTGGAFLHLNERASRLFSAAAAKAAMALFGSTSPAYPTLVSLDLARDWWQREGVAAYRATAQAVASLKQTAQESGWIQPAFTGCAPLLRDPARLTLEVCRGDGVAAADFFRAQGCESEYADSRYIVFILTPFNTEEERERLRAALEAGTKAMPAATGAPAFSAMLRAEHPRRALSPREALLRPFEELPTAHCVGRIAARSVCPCPPGVAAIVPGEVVDAATAMWLRERGYDRLIVTAEVAV